MTEFPVNPTYLGDEVPYQGAAIPQDFTTPLATVSPDLSGAYSVTINTPVRVHLADRTLYLTVGTHNFGGALAQSLINAGVFAHA